MPYCFDLTASHPSGRPERKRERERERGKERDRERGENTSQLCHLAVIMPPHSITHPPQPNPCIFYTKAPHPLPLPPPYIPPRMLIKLLGNSNSYFRKTSQSLPHQKHPLTYTHTTQAHNSTTSYISYY